MAPWPGQVVAEGAECRTWTAPWGLWVLPPCSLAPTAWTRGRTCCASSLTCTPCLGAWPRRFEKHVAVSDRVKDVVASWGLHMLPTSRALAAHTMTGIYLPDGITQPEVRVMASLFPLRLHHLIMPKCCAVMHIWRKLGAAHSLGALCSLECVCAPHFSLNIKPAACRRCCAPHPL